MQDMPPSYVQKKPARSCLMSGCLVLAGLVGLVVVLVIGGCFYFGRTVGPFFSDHPVALRSNDTTKEQYMAAVRKLQPLLNPDAPGQTTPTVPTPVSLTADDLNSFLAHDPHLSSEKDKCYFTIPADQLIVDVSAEIPQQSTRSARSFYFNGRVSGDVDISGGSVRLNPRSIESLDGKPFPAWITNSAFFQSLVDGINQGLNKSLHDNTDVAEMLARIESTRIANGQITLTPANAKDTPAPVATPSNR